MPHVLIVEDDPEVAEMLNYLLRGEGYSTQLAANGARGLDSLRQRRPCLVLLDIMMPVMDGWEFREQQLRDPSIANVPVLCVTAVNDLTKVKERLKVECLHKPVDYDALLDAVSAQCRATRSGARPAESC